MKYSADSRRNFFKTAGLLSAVITILPSVTVKGVFLPRKNSRGGTRTVRPVDGKWAPGGGNKSLRWKDEWVRISWDEALDIVATDLPESNPEGINTIIQNIIKESIGYLFLVLTGASMTRKIFN